MDDKIRVLVADDHAIVRTGLVTLLGRAADIEVVGEANDGNDAVAKAMKLNPDVVVLDLVMPRKDGVAATAELHAKRPDMKILILTSFGPTSGTGTLLSARPGAAFSLTSAYIVSRICPFPLVS